MNPLERARLELGVATKREWAERLGMSPGQYGDLCAGRTGLTTRRVADIVAQLGGVVTEAELVARDAARDAAA